MPAPTEATLPLRVLSDNCFIAPFPKRDQIPPPLLEVPVTVLPLIVLELRFKP